LASESGLVWEWPWVLATASLSAQELGSDSVLALPSAQVKASAWRLVPGWDSASVLATA
jgi:hypothetical protein